MRLPGIDPEIELYTQGFDDICALDRASEGKALSSLLERVITPQVVAVDGPWGCGKSFFLKCWVGAHKADYGTQTNLLYFDAFAHDYLDDPLTSLVSALGERLEQVKAEESKSDTLAKTALDSGVKKLKRAAPILAKGIARTALNVATSGALSQIENLDESLIDDAIKGASAELNDAIGEFWKAERSRRAAMDLFKNGLEGLSEDGAKLIIVVDELDRCRPDYALQLLEVIKHFFNVENVHFVLGVNLRELENSVRARYGNKVNAATYLQKFYSLIFALKANETKGASGQTQLAVYFNKIADECEVGKNPVREALETLLNHLSLSDVTLRTLERITTTLILANFHRQSANGDDALHLLRAALIVVKVVAPDLYTRVRTQTVTAAELTTFFNLKADITDRSANTEALLLAAALKWCFGTPLDEDETNYFGRCFPPRSLDYLGVPPQDALSFICREELDIFSLPA